MPARKPITVEDLYLIKTVEDAQISPDGERVAYTLWTLDKAANKNKRAIWIVPARGGQPKQFTSGDKPDTSPRWSPDGKTLAFVSARSDRPQIYLIDVAGGEARRLTNASNGASTPVWSPDGSRLAFLSPVNAQERRDADRGVKPPDDPISAKILEEQKKKAEEEKSDPRVHVDLPYRTGTDYVGDRRSHIYVIDAAGGDPVRLTDGDRDYGEPEWSPDGRFIYTDVKRDRASSLFLYHDLVRIPAEPGRKQPGPLRRYRDAKGYSAYAPKVSPDGRWIAFVRAKEKDIFGDVSPIAVRAASGRGSPIEITAQFDRTPEGYEWTRDSRSIVFTAGDRGETPIWKVSRAGGKVTRVAGGRWHVLTSFSQSKTGRLAFTVSAPDFPRDVFVAEADGSRTRRLTRVNDGWLKARYVALPKELRYKSPDGWEIQGFVQYPPDFKPGGKKYPVVVEVHGGPQVMWAPAGVTMWHELNVMAGAGYVTFWCNPRGSDGYGTRFAKGLVDDWGASMPDIMAGIDKVIAAGGIDEKRICLTGGSYGGWATAWLIGHSDRFAAAAALRGVYNLISFDGTTDIHEFIASAYHAYHWEDHDRLWQQSPLAHVKNIRTPLLILHAEHDYRVPISDGEQLFAALKRLGRAVQLVRYPREGHEQTRSGEPKHRVDSMQRILDWFARYGKKR
jgi:dipeptidyl aminopeptidase/acylaminoacyl peptidase